MKKSNKPQTKLKTIENIKKISLAFFIVTGSIHIISGLMTANDYMMPTSLVINRILDIPFAMTALIYGMTSLHETIPTEKKKIANIVFIALSVLILGILLYINLFVPDRTALIK